MSNKPTQKAPTPRAKKLTINKVKQEAKLINQFTTYIWDAETNTQLKYYERFDDNKIEELLSDLHQAIVHCAENELEFFNGEIGDANLLKYIHFLIIKHFSDLKSQIPNDFESNISAMQDIISIGLFARAFDEIFNLDEVGRVLDKVTDLIAKSEQLVLEQTKAQDKANEFMSNSDNLKQLKKLNDHIDVIHPIVAPDVMNVIEDK